MSIPAHPYADLFPMLAPADADALREDIAANGLRERIVILDDMILDGRNRYLALYGFSDAGLPPEGDERWISQFRHFVPAQDGDPLTWVLSKNLHRRHLSESQRAMVAAKLEGFRHGGVRPNSDKQDANLHLDRAAAAEQLHVSPRSVASARDVIDHGAPELVAKVDAGEVAVSAAAEVAKLPVSEQLRILREEHPREFRRAVKEHRGERQAEKKDRRLAREAELGARQAALPDKRYGVILADPEWQFKAFSDETGMDRAADNHYPTSSLEVIKSRPVADIAADDCALLLWATVPMLPQALEVMAAWGFAYKSHVAGRKDRAGTGYWFRNQHELLLLGTRGKVPAPAMGDQVSSVQEFPVGEHSAKPPFAHEIAEAYFPSLPKIELNARQRRDGWDAWGLEAPPEESQAKASVDGGTTEPETDLAAADSVTGEASRPDAGWSASATSERTDATGGESAATNSWSHDTFVGGMRDNAVAEFRVDKRPGGYFPSLSYMLLGAPCSGGFKASEGARTANQAAGAAMSELLRRFSAIVARPDSQILDRHRAGIRAGAEWLRRHAEQKGVTLDEDVRPVSKAEALEIIKARYTGDNGQQLADELGRPLNTIRKWAWEAGVSDQGRNLERAMANLATINARRETAS